MKLSFQVIHKTEIYSISLLKTIYINMKQKGPSFGWPLTYNKDIKINYQISAPIQVHVAHAQGR